MDDGFLSMGRPCYFSYKREKVWEGEREWVFEFGEDWLKEGTRTVWESEWEEVKDLNWWGFEEQEVKKVSGRESS